MRREPPRGFTLIELTLVIAILAILAAIAIPQFSEMVARSREGATKGNLGTLRTALSLYYGDTDGSYPFDNTQCLTYGSKYLRAIPSAYVPEIATVNPGHATSATVINMGASLSLVDTGGWAYQSDPTNPTSPLPGFNTPAWGSVMANCLHNDSRGTIWAFN